jgi:hypothetical protein
MVRPSSANVSVNVALANAVQSAAQSPLHARRHRPEESAAWSSDADARDRIGGALLALEESKRRVRRYEEKGMTLEASVSETSDHPVTGFRLALSRLAVDRYPAGVIPLPGIIDGTAFFSGGPGLYCERPPSVDGLPPFPFGGVIFIGNNLDAETAYLRRLAEGRPHGDIRSPMRTWRHLYNILGIAGLDPRGCFFTNAYVGLVGGDTAVGRFPGADDPWFTGWCESFLRHQIEIMHPSVLVTLGADARRFVGALSDDLTPWTTTRPAQPAVCAARIDGHEVRGIALAHPSMHPASAASRHFADQSGIAAEAALIRAALAEPLS